MTLLVNVVGLVLVVWLAMALSGAWWLRRRNRVAPRSPTRAPLLWLVSPERAAVLHRRLRRAVAGARAAAVWAAGVNTAPRRGPDGLIGCVCELEHHAVTVDAHLVLAAGCSPVVRRNLLRGLETEVTGVERVAARISSAALTPADRAPGTLSALERMSDHLDALDAAHVELAALEASWVGPPLGGARPFAPGTAAYGLEAGRRRRRRT